MSHVGSRAGDAAPAPRVGLRIGSILGRGRPRRKGRRHLLIEALEPRLALTGGFGAPFLDVSSDPYFLQARLGGAETAGSTFFGWALDATADGDVVAVASPGAPVSGQVGVGNVAIYERTGREWAETAVLTRPGPETAPYLFGVQVALSDDGSTLVVGGGGQPSSPYTLFIYERDAADWTFTQRVDLEYGYSSNGVQRFSRLAVSGDGDVIAVGSPNDYGLPTQPSVVRVLTRGVEDWSVTAELAPPDAGAGRTFGASVALSADGGTLAVGAERDLVQGSDAGAVYVYREAAGAWGVPERIDAAPNGSNFGSWVSLSGDGATLLISGVEVAPGPILEARGAAYVYEADGPGWTQTARFVSPGGGDEAAFARSVSLSPDGLTAAVAAPGLQNQRAAAYMYGSTGGVWGPIASFASDSPGPYGTFAVPVVATGADVFAAHGGPRSLDEAGSIHVYHRPAGLEVILDPADATTSPLTPTTFLAGAAGADGLSVRWQVSEDGVAWSDLPGAVFDWYTVVPTLADSGQRYRAVFTDGEGGEAITRPATMTVRKATPIVVIDSNHNPRLREQWLTLTVRVSSDGSTPNTPDGGVVTLTAGGVQYTGEVRDGVATFELRGDLAAPGAYVVTAAYDGAADPTFGPAAGSLVQVTLKTVLSTETLVDPASPISGQDVVIMARLRPADTFGAFPPPTGLIAFYEGDTYLGSSRVLGAGDPLELAYAAILRKFDGAGTRSISWTYSGDAWYEAAASAPVIIEVQRASTTISAYPEGSGIFYYGVVPTYQVAATGFYERPAPGPVSVTVAGYDGPPIPDLTLGPQGRGGVALPAPLAPGGHTVTFNYLGTDEFGPSSFTTGFGVYKAPTSLVLRSNRSVLGLGQEVVFTAVVFNSAAPDYNPTSGVMQFYVGAALLGEAEVGADGRARFATTTLPLGEHVVTAVYKGSGNFQAGMSNRYSQLIVASDTVTTLTSSANPATAGVMMEFHADVRATNGAPWANSGLVRFYVGLNPVAEVPIDVTGRATLPARFDVASRYLITAVYLGSPGFGTSQSQHLGQVVAPAPVPPALNARTSANPPASQRALPGGPVSAAAFTTSVAASSAATPDAPTQARPEPERTSPPVRARRAARLAAQAEVLSRLAVRKSPATRIGRWAGLRFGDTSSA
ncbi:Ig-like domain repeat protein [Paludisphaera soli]|uniref:Ig-like domain repeat protein n=1 Tax=Paludisphaera soli TaxID=2712865 RepID=UPI0013E9A752|nr:Ig-like domain repeat protein [Paludisphaera soli]